VIASTDFPRSLSAREAEVLTFMLDLDDPRLAALRDQVPTATVVDRCHCGCATIDLSVDRSSGEAAVLCSPVTETWAKGDPTDPDRFFELILFAKDGWLTSLEIVYYGKTIPTEFPPASYFETPYLDC
jgi:hypothetical protein